MYTRCDPARAGQQLSGLGLSLKPPSWLRDAAKKVVSDTVSTATDAAKRAAADALARAQAQVAPKPTPMDAVNEAVSSIPGGWLTIAAVGLGLLLVAKRRG